MAKNSNTKRRLIEVLKVLFDRTDGDHGLSLPDISAHLEGLGISNERKALYDDIATLRECGIDVRVWRDGGRTVYAIADRPLSMRDLSLLVDCVQSSPFLTDELSGEVHDDLLALASVHERGRLRGQIEVPGRVHLANEGVFENLDVIREAIRSRRQVTFRYFTYGVNRNRVYHEYGETGDRRTMTPVRLVFTGGLYYVVMWEHWYGKFAYYRLDRMDDVEVSDEESVRNLRIASYSVGRDESVAFGLFAAERETVSLLLDSRFVNALVDKFGLDVDTYPQEDGKVKANVTVTLSPNFLGWVFSLEGGCTIVGPRSAVDRYRHFVDRALATLDPDGVASVTDAGVDGRAI